MSDDRLLSTARRLGHLFHTDAVRAGDRGPDDDADVLWPVGEDFSLAGATDWIGSERLTGADLRGRVVAINFWTFTCINWLRQLPYIRAWDEAYRDHGLVVVGVHSPEFAVEHDVDAVRRAVDVMSIRHPVAVDNHFAVWRSFRNHYWPALYLVDAGGMLRHHVFGEGQYEETETVIRGLLAAAGAGDLGPEPAVEGQGIEAAADWGTLRSAETYLGYERTVGFASTPPLAPERPRAYATPDRLRLGHWGLSGTWTAGREATVSQEAGGRLTCRFQARDLHLVAGPDVPGTGIPFRVLLDGRPPARDHGVDVDDAGRGTLTEPRLYQLVRRQGAVDAGTFEVEFEAPGAAVLALTFG